MKVTKDEKYITWHKCGEFDVLYVHFKEQPLFIGIEPKLKMSKIQTW